MTTMKKLFPKITFFYMLFSFAVCQYSSSMKTAKIYEMDKNWDAAISIYKDIIRKSPNNFQAIRSLKNIYKRSQRYDNGINLYDDFAHHPTATHRGFYKIWQILLTYYFE